MVPTRNVTMRNLRIVSRNWCIGSATFGGIYDILFEDSTIGDPDTVRTWYVPVRVSILFRIRIELPFGFFEFVCLNACVKIDATEKEKKRTPTRRAVFLCFSLISILLFHMNLIRLPVHGLSNLRVIAIIRDPWKISPYVESKWVGSDQHRTCFRRFQEKCLRSIWHMVNRHPTIRRGNQSFEM